MFYLRRLINNATIVTINIVNAKSDSYVTIAVTKVRMKRVHRHHSFQVNLKGAKKILFLARAVVKEETPEAREGRWRNPENRTRRRTGVRQRLFSALAGERLSACKERYGES